ncbi:MAG: hypothetical protein IT162_20490 [Bryobacterales bacterium]|nr:hypothetical protein [Bryobacterales bacterium]
MLLLTAHIRIISRLRGSLNPGTVIGVQHFATLPGVITNHRPALGGPAWRGIVLLRREGDAWRPVVDNAAAGISTVNLAEMSVLAGESVGDAIARVLLRREVVAGGYSQFAHAALDAMSIVGMYRAALLVRAYLFDPDIRLRDLACLVLAARFPGQTECLQNVREQQLGPEETKILAEIRAREPDVPWLLRDLRAGAGRGRNLGSSSVCDHVMLLVLSQNKTISIEASKLVTSRCSRPADLRYYSPLVQCGDTSPAIRRSCDSVRLVP